MATKVAHSRLMREYKMMQESAPPFITAHPSDKNILVWHYLITGPPDTPYAGGQYHGTLTFPGEYPYKPPAIRMITPSGRFQPNTRLCLSISDFHPKTWNPAWSVSTILTGLLSFMTSDELTTGALRSTDREKRLLALSSHEWNVRQNRRFVEEFPSVAKENEPIIVGRRRQITADAASATLANANAPGTFPSPQAEVRPPAGPGNQRVANFGKLDTSILAAPTAGKKNLAGNNGNRETNIERKWLANHKVLCVCVAVLACVVVSRISGTAGNL
ncbi:ubiquitin-conjugating enzyme/RWD-like protein [Lipomyces japonicus]|uniref:ubiquitin-conjugating enzyme/RWD-like protein n=1 Tax=Lipomyces japonicus TaxID=56871 RepID=UPI0034CF5824